MNKRLTKKSLAIIISAVLLLAIGVTATVMVTSADNQASTMPFYSAGPDLAPGRYYVDGDTSQYYYELTEDKTMQLIGVDYLEYALYGNDPTLMETDEEFAAMVNETVERLSTPTPYVTKHNNYSNLDAIYWEFYEHEDGSATGIGYDIDSDNSFVTGHGERFIRVEDGETYIVDESNLTRKADAVFE